jgi:predicted O-methyltransferase YrrM
VSEEGTAAHLTEPDLPPLVARAVSVAVAMGFENSCRPEQGRLLGLLVAGRPGAVVGEAGTGTGVGLAWLASAAAPGTRLVSVEADAARAAAAREVFADRPDVEVLHGDWRLLSEYAPFDLLVIDGGTGKEPVAPDPDPVRWLAPGGAIVNDDFTPRTLWPPVVGDRPGGDVDTARLRWLSHPDLLVTEIVTGATCALVGIRR